MLSTASSAERNCKPLTPELLERRNPLVGIEQESFVFDRTNPLADIFPDFEAFGCRAKSFLNFGEVRKLLAGRSIILPPPFRATNRRRNRFGPFLLPENRGRGGNRLFRNVKRNVKRARTILSSGLAVS
jgi:hypothetical protein